MSHFFLSKDKEPKKVDSYTKIIFIFHSEKLLQSYGTFLIH